jgi:hypothetical protein
VAAPYRRLARSRRCSPSTGVSIIRRCPVRLPLIALALISACGAKPRPEPAGPPDRVTVPLHVEGNRPFIDVTFRGSVHHRLPAAGGCPWAVE